MPAMRTVLLVQRRLTDYRVPLFERLRDRLAEDDVEFHVVFGTPKPGEVSRRDSGYLSWGTMVPCRNIGFLGLQIVIQNIPKHLYGHQDLLIMSQENQQLFNYRIFFQGSSQRLAYWGHGRNFQENRKTFGTWLKTKLARRVDWWFAYTERSLPPILEAGFPLERVTCLNNTVDVQEMLTWRQGIADVERRALLSALDLNGARVGVFLGGLIPEKRVRFLCGAADLLKHRFPDFELFVIGDGPNRGEILDFAASRPWVRWVGPRHGRDKIIHVSLGHVMLNPGMVGLGIFDGFACGVPMVTTDCGIHSPEIAYLESGRNGLMTADRLEDFVEGAAKLLEDEGLRTRLAAQGQQDARKYTLDKMVDCFAEGILKAMDAPPLAHDGHWRT